MASSRNTGKEICSVDDCKFHTYSRGVCNKHYQRFMQNGTLKKLINDPNECSGPIKARGMCKKHYDLWLKDPANTSKKIVRYEYPSEEEILALYKKHYSTSAVVREIGGSSRKTFENWLDARPELRARIQPYIGLPREVVEQRYKESQRRWRQNNPEKVKENKRRWASNRSKEDVQKWNSYNSERRKRQAGEPLSVKDALLTNYYEEIIKQDPCVYCGKLGVNTIDHIVPINKNGNSLWTNLAGVCWSCNSSKKDKDVLQFLLWRLDHVA